MTECIVRVSVKSELPSDRLKLCMVVIALQELVDKILDGARWQIAETVDKPKIEYFPCLEDTGNDGIRIGLKLKMNMLAPKSALMLMEQWRRLGAHVTILDNADQ